jgi:hypothetical protein
VPIQDHTCKICHACHIIHPNATSADACPSLLITRTLRIHIFMREMNMWVVHSCMYTRKSICTLWIHWVMYACVFMHACQNVHSLWISSEKFWCRAFSNGILRTFSSHNLVAADGLSINKLCHKFKALIQKNCILALVLSVWLKGSTFLSCYRSDFQVVGYPVGQKASGIPFSEISLQRILDCQYTPRFLILCHLTATHLFASSNANASRLKSRVSHNKKIPKNQPNHHAHTWRAPARNNVSVPHSMP